MMINIHNLIVHLLRYPKDRKVSFQRPKPYLVHINAKNEIIYIYIALQIKYVCGYMPTSFNRVDGRK